MAVSSLMSGLGAAFLFFDCPVLGVAVPGVVVVCGVPSPRGPREVARAWSRVDPFRSAAAR